MNNVLRGIIVVNKKKTSMTLTFIKEARFLYPDLSYIIFLK